MILQSWCAEIIAFLVFLILAVRAIIVLLRLRLAASLMTFNRDRAIPRHYHPKKWKIWLESLATGTWPPSTMVCLARRIMSICSFYIVHREVSRLLRTSSMSINHCLGVLLCMSLGGISSELARINLPLVIYDGHHRPHLVSIKASLSAEVYYCRYDLWETLDKKLSHHCFYFRTTLSLCHKKLFALCLAPRRKTTDFERAYFGVV